jgi:hypothetical protein
MNASIAELNISKRFRDGWSSAKTCPHWSQNLALRRNWVLHDWHHNHTIKITLFLYRYQNYLNDIKKQGCFSKSACPFAKNASVKAGYTTPSCMSKQSADMSTRHSRYSGASGLHRKSTFEVFARRSWGTREKLQAKWFWWQTRWFKS